VAQRTGADDLLAPKAKSASARVLLALALSTALLLAGCGGGGDSPEQSDTAATAAQQASGQRGEGASKATKEGSPESKPHGSGATATGKATPDSNTSSQGTGKPSPAAATLPKQGREKEASPAEEAQATVADIVFSSPDLKLEESTFAIPPTYTCDGKNSWPALEWEGLPSGTQELLIFAMNIQPVGGHLFFDWAVAGIDPSTERIEAGKLPPGAVQGQNSSGTNGYDICPTKGSPETYVFTLYAIPTRLSPPRGFDPHVLREEALRASGSAGIFAASYGR
jgi:phosphatidylethanolamine-binding protein (PEBP) family uncharacterized protein